ncbi:MAG: antibiotic biosynthesis monooxygenase [Sphingorhabdus sp.]
MTNHPAGTIAVIFVAQRTGEDEAGYRAAAARMEELASRQPGYAGIDSVRQVAGLGITVSYWRDDGCAKAWRDNSEHTAIRELGRKKWYSDYSLHVAAITRSYDWQKPGPEPE